MAEKSIGKEFLELAVVIEKKGRDFYESVAQKDIDKEAQKIFKQLAAREKEHEHTFRDMLERLGGYTPPNEYPKEHYMYIKNLADSSIFAGDRARLLLTSEKISDVEAIKTGIGFEKDSILFYSEVRGMVPRQDQEIIDVITSEEKKHLSELIYLANRL